MVAVTNLADRPTPNGFPGVATACPVKVIHGANNLILNKIVGQTVATIHIWTRDVLNTPRWCVAYLNGQHVNRHHRVRSGDTLEFIYPWGFKGNGDLLLPADLMAWRRVTPEQYEELLRRGLPSVRGKDGSRLHRREDVHRWFAIVPPGAPSWVKADRIAETIRVWQPRYKELLTPDDALEIMVNARNLLDVLFPLGGEGKEAVQ
jgi:hypothetical protein